MNSDGMRAARTFLASFLVLFLEIALIRWMPAYIRLLSYFSNFILLASFLGIGLGCLLAPVRARLFSWFPLVQALVIGAVYYFPDALVANTNAAFEVNGKTLANLDRNAPCIGPAEQPGQLGSRISLYGPRQQKWDFSLVKKTYLNEKGMNLRP